MFVELHILQNFAPSNLNRDDTNAPKSAMFGGFRRARISSQCIKRSVRTHPAFEKIVRSAGGDVGIRTKRILDQITRGLVGHGHDAETSASVAATLLSGLELKVEKEGKTQYLLYVGPGEIDRLIAAGHRHFDTLAAVQGGPESGEKDAKGKNKREKSDKKAAIPKEILKEIGEVFAGTLAADIALFGRMVADSKNVNVDAACQVAHALSTHEVDMEMDFYTAVDDLLPEDASGSDMMGTVEFNSSCFYRYAVVHVDSLLEDAATGRKGLDAEQARAAVLGFVEASILAIPTGKQNSHAAHNPPAYVRLLARKDGAPWSLANAFVQPIRPGRKPGEDLVTRSISALETHFNQLTGMYGKEGILLDAVSRLDGGPEGMTVSTAIGRLEQCLRDYEGTTR